HEVTAENLEKCGSKEQRQYEDRIHKLLAICSSATSGQESERSGYGDGRGLRCFSSRSRCMASRSSSGGNAGFPSCLRFSIEAPTETARIPITTPSATATGISKNPEIIIFVPTKTRISDNP